MNLAPKSTVSRRQATRYENVASSSTLPKFVGPTTLCLAPEFTQPMFEQIEAHAQNILLQGIENVPQNTIGLLKSNRRFIEAFLCGMNHEFSKELLWREYPMEQHATYFRQFWDRRGYQIDDDTIMDDIIERYGEANNIEQWSPSRIQAFISYDLPGSE